MKEPTKATHHTPGPWHISSWRIAKDSGAVGGQRKFLHSDPETADGHSVTSANAAVVDIPRGTTSGLADAALIAAAPDLAAALAALVAECSAARTPTVAQWNAAHDALRKAGIL